MPYSILDLCLSIQAKDALTHNSQLITKPSKPRSCLPSSSHAPVRDPLHSVRRTYTLL